MSTLQAVILILLVHFLADFGLQTHEQATEKSKNTVQLLYHVAIYTGVWFFASIVLFGSWWKPIIFTPVIGVLHFYTDFFSSKLSKSYFEKEDYHNGFVVIGADQFLHYFQLFLMYFILR